MNFIRHKVVNMNVIGFVFSLIIFGLFTDETSRFLDRIFEFLPFTQNNISFLTISALSFFLILHLIVHVFFIKRIRFATLIATLQLVTQFAIINFAILVILPFRYQSIMLERMVFYSVSMFVICASISVTFTGLDYVRSIRYLRKLETIMAKHPKNREEKQGRFLRFGGFLWKDFETGLVVRREEVKKITQILEVERFCFLSGKQASGKSVILRSVGYNLLSKYVVFLIEDLEQLDLDKALADIERWNLSNVLVMVDDVHRNPILCSRFLQRVQGLNIKVLFSSRPLNPVVFREGEGTDLLEIYKRRIEAQVSRQVISEMIRKYCYSLRLRKKITDKDVDSIIQKCGTDLWLVTYLLASWNPRKQRLESISKKNIYQKIYETRITQWFKLGDKAQEVMQIVSALYQYEIPMFERMVIERNLMEATMKLAENGFLVKTDQYYCLHHPSVAKIYLDTFFFYKMIDDTAKVSSTILASYFNEIEEGRARGLYKLAIIPKLSKTETEIIKNLAKTIETGEFASQIDQESDISKIGSFFRLFSQMDKKIARKVLHSIDKNALKEKFLTELLVGRQTKLLYDISIVDKNYIDEIGLIKPFRVAILILKNDEPFLPQIMPSLKDFVDSVLVIDDNSKDLTATKAETLGAKVLKNKETMGPMDSILKGLELAKESDANFTLIFPRPLSVSNLNELIKPVILGKVDLVTGDKEWAPQAMNAKGMDLFLKYIKNERKEQLSNSGLTITSVLFSKLLRTRKVSLSYRIPPHLLRFYRAYRDRRRYASVPYRDFYLREDEILHFPFLKETDD